MIKEHQKIEYLKLIKNKKLSVIDDPNFLQRLEIASFLDTHNNTENITSLNEGSRGNDNDYIFQLLIKEGYIQENMKAGLSINDKFSLTAKGKAYLKNNPNYALSKVEGFLTDYPLFFTNLIAGLALVISIIALYKN